MFLIDDESVATVEMQERKRVEYMQLEEELMLCMHRLATIHHKVLRGASNAVLTLRSNVREFKGLRKARLTLRSLNGTVVFCFFRMGPCLICGAA